MADQDIRLRERLHDLATDAEPSIRLASPEAVRARGGRRRFRRRAATVTVAVYAVVALTVVGWQALPGGGPDRKPLANPPAAPVVASPAPATALLPPTALPFDASAHWRTTATTDAPRQVQTTLVSLGSGCRFVSGGDRTPASHLVRTYRGDHGETARQTIASYPTERAATATVASLTAKMHDWCGLTPRTGPSATHAVHPVKGVTSFASRAGTTQLHVTRVGTHLSVLQTEGLPTLADQYDDGPATYCLTVSRWRLDPSVGPSPAPYPMNPEEADRRC